MNPEFKILIPARFSSERLPGKPLRDVAGKPLIQRVYECAKASLASSVTVATDDDGIYQAVVDFGGAACMTSKEHTNGTERLAEAIERLAYSDDTIVVNLQGDEPLIPVALINQVAQCLQDDPESVISTACCPLNSVREYQDPNVVKVVRDQNSRAQYFSRSPIPWFREAQDNMPVAARWSVARRHLGIYAYRVKYLRRFCGLAASPTEEVEKLEQLRALWYGDTIVVCDAVETPGPGIDTLSDLAEVIHIFEQHED